MVWACHPGGKRETCHFFSITLSKVKNSNFRGDVCWDWCLYKCLFISCRVTKYRNQGSCWTVAIQDPSASCWGQKFLLKATPCQENYPELLTSVSGMWGWSDAADILAPAESTVSTVSGNSRRSRHGVGPRACFAVGWGWRWPWLRWLCTRAAELSNWLPSATGFSLLFPYFFLA